VSLLSVGCAWGDLLTDRKTTYPAKQTTNLTQYDSHGPNAHPKTIDEHHLDMSRDDGMDEHGID
jgi:hypothetical protein